MNSPLRMLHIFFVLTLCTAELAIPGRLPQRSNQVNDGVVQDSVIVSRVLKVVRTHVLSVTKDRRKPLVVKEGKKARRFIVVNFLGTVSRSKGIYTAELDADEFDHKIPRILYVDVKPSQKSFRVIRIRIGPNRFRPDESSH